MVMNTLAARLWIALTMAVLAAGVVVSAAGTAHAVSRENLNRGVLATVKIYTVDAQANVIAGCSGTVIHPAGYILTNFHCVGLVNEQTEDPSGQGLRPGDLYHPQGLVAIGPTLDPRKPPVPTYVAQTLSGTPELDIAVLKIIGTLQESGVEQAPENLPLVIQPLGDSDQVQIGDPLTVIGYPGVGGPTVTVTSGQVSGFDDRNEDGTPDSIKTDASIAPGNSGGLGLNDEGLQIGIPTWQLSSGANKIDRLMMANLAVPYIEEALKAGTISEEGSGQRSVPSTRTGPNTQPTSGPFGPITFATGISDQGSLVGEGTSFPSGTTSVFGVFAYKGMRDGAPWGYQWILNEQVVIDKRNTESWDLGAEGTSYASLSAQNGMPDGDYQLVLYVGNREVQRGSFTVGGGRPQEPLPPKKPAQPTDSGVVLTGLIGDVDTGRPIPGAAFIVLKPGVTIEQFQSSEGTELIAAAAIADDNGAFRTAPGLERGQTYTVIVGARGYQPRAFVDALNLPSNAPSVIELDPIGLRQR